jgi:uncharacterized membrane protein
LIEQKRSSRGNPGCPAARRPRDRGSGAESIRGCCNYAASGALSGRLTDLSINDDFMKRAARTLRSGNAALFLLICKMTTGTVLSSSVDETKEEVLQAALAGARAASAEAGG